MPTIKDVARAAGVSVATVSRSMHPESASSVTPETRERIRKVSEELGYRPNPLARALKTNRSGIVGFLIPSLDNPFYMQVLRHLEAKLTPAGYRILTTFLRDRSEEESAIRDLLSLHADALLFCALDRRSEDILRSCADRCRPIQLFNAAYPDFVKIVIDDAEGARIATSHLLSLGHKRIFFAGGDGRIEGYRKAFCDAGLPAPDQAFIAPPFCIDESLLARLITESGATAVLGISRQGYHAYRALHALGLEIPEKMSLVVYDDSEWAELLGITAVAHPLDIVANAVAECLTAGRGKPSPNAPDFPLTTIVKPHLIIRNSTGPFRS